MLHIEHSSVRLHNYLKKITVGEGWGILSVGRIQLAFYLEIAGGKNHQCLRSILSRWRHLAAISFLLLSVVLGSAREILRLLHHTEVADPHPPAVHWRKADHGPAPRCDLRGSSCGNACGGWRRPCVQWTSPWRCLMWVWCTAWWCQRPPQCSCRQGWWLALPFQLAGLRSTVAALGLHASRWPSHLLVVPRDYAGHVGHAAVAYLYSASVKVLA